MTEWHIRRAEAADAPALAQCITAAYAAYAVRIPDLPAVAEGIPEQIADHLVWVAEAGTSVIGGMVLAPDDGFLKLVNIAVHPQSSGAGIGTALIARAETHCRELGMNRMRLITHSDIPENLRFYERLGWRQCGRDGNRVHMEKRLVP